MRDHPYKTKMVYRIDTWTNSPPCAWPAAARRMAGRAELWAGRASSAASAGPGLRRRTTCCACPDLKANDLEFNLNKHKSQHYIVAHVVEH